MTSTSFWQLLRQHWCQAVWTLALLLDYFSDVERGDISDVERGDISDVERGGGLSDVERGDISDVERGTSVTWREGPQ